MNQDNIVTVMMLILNNSVLKTLHKFLMIRSLNNKGQ